MKRPLSFMLMGAALVLLCPAPTMAQNAVSVAKHVEPDGTHTLVHEVIVDAPAREVWAAISTAEGWKTWAVPVAWVPPGQSDILETSYNPAAKPGDPETIQQRFLARIPGRLLAFRTVKAPAKFPHWEAYQLVSSVFELEQSGPKRTKVRLTGVGYPDSPAGKQLISFFERGNSASLEWLRARFIEGPADWSKRLAPKK